MRRYSAVFTTALLAAILTTPGCRGNTPDDEAAIRERLETTDTAALMEAVSKAHYEPPADGRLTEEQIRMYLEVKARETRILEVAAREPGAALSSGALPSAGPGGDPGGGEVMDDLVTAGLRAAQELGYNPKEYAWVEARVQEARMAEASQALERQLGDGRAKYLSMLEAEKAAADEARKAEIEAQIQEFKQDAAESALQLTEAVRSNIALLAGHRQKIEQADAAEARAAAARLQPDADTEAADD